MANRITTIREATIPSQWHYVSSKENPADDASRGVRAGDFLQNCRWTEGLKFLVGPEESWPMNVTETALGVDDKEVKGEAMVNVTIVDSSLNATSQLMAYFSDWRKLKAAVAWFLKLKRNLLEMSHRRRVSEAQVEQQRQGTKGQTLSVEDLVEAELAIIRYCQQQRFAEEIVALGAGKDTVSK